MGARILGFVIGILSLLYFGMYAAFAGLTNKFTFFWLLLGIGCILIAGMWKRIGKLFRTIPKLIKGAGIVLIVLFILALTISEILIISYGVSEPKEGADYVIVLGAQVRGRTPSYNLARRLDKAYEYLKDNPKTQVILSGGQGEGEEVSEAFAMAEYLEKRGVSGERMLLEDKSTNTYENIKYSRELIEDKNAEIILVTNNFHVYRSIGIAKKQGLTKVEGMGAPVMWYTIPNMYLREAFAVIKYALCGQI